MKTSRGFSLVEMEVAIVIASILVLTIGALGSISLGASNKARQEAMIFSDLANSFETLQNKVRSAQTLSTPALSRLNVDASNFQIQAAGTLMAFVFNDAALGQPQILFLFDPNKNPVNDSLNFSAVCGSGCTHVTARLWGVRDGISFDLSNTIKRRAQ